jgi:chorismate mutase
MDAQLVEVPAHLADDVVRARQARGGEARDPARILGAVVVAQQQVDLAAARAARRGQHLGGGPQVLLDLHQLHPVRQAPQRRQAAGVVRKAPVPARQVDLHAVGLHALAGQRRDLAAQVGKARRDAGEGDDDGASRRGAGPRSECGGGGEAIHGVRVTGLPDKPVGAGGIDAGSSRRAWRGASRNGGLRCLARHGRQSSPRGRQPAASSRPKNSHLLTCQYIAFQRAALEKKCCQPVSPSTFRVGVEIVVAAPSAIATRRWQDDAFTCRPVQLGRLLALFALSIYFARGLA